MNRLEYSDILLEIIRKKHPELNCIGVVRYLCESGLIEEKRAIRWIIKNEYFIRIKDKSKTFTEHKLDLSVEFDVSRSFIDKILYYYDDIRC